MRKVTLPVMLPGLLGVTIFVGTATIGIFEIPAILGMPRDIHVFATRIYLATSQVPRDYGLATSLGTVAAAIGIVGIYYYHRVTRIQQRFATITGKGYRPRRIDLGKYRRWAGAAIIGYFCLMVVLPTVVLLYASTQPFFRPPSLHAFANASLEGYRIVFKQEAFWIGLRNSLTLIGTVPAATILLSAIVSWIVVRSRARGRGLLDTLAFVPFNRAEHRLRPRVLPDRAVGGLDTHLRHDLAHRPRPRRTLPRLRHPNDERRDVPGAPGTRGGGRHERRGLGDGVPPHHAAVARAVARGGVAVGGDPQRARALHGVAPHDARQPDPVHRGVVGLGERPHRRGDGARRNPHGRS